MGKTGVAATAIIALLALTLYTLLVYTGAAPLPQPLTPLYHAFKPIYEKILGPRQQTPKPQAPQPPSHPPICLLEARNGTGYTVYLVKTGGTCPSAWSYRVVPRHGWRIASITLRAPGRTASLNATGSLIIHSNASLVVEAERLYATLRILVNASAPYLLNGTEHRGNMTIRVPLGARVNITLLQGTQRGSELVPVNSSTALEVDGNATVRLYWLLRCDGVLIASNVGGVSARVDGVLRRLPYCARAPVVVEGLFYGGGINSTHGWWLGWYWVREGNRTWWWSYGINGSRLRVVRPARVTLYYLPGLKDLPYVERVVEFPEGFFNGSCPLNPGKAVEDWEVKDGWVHVYNPRPCSFNGENTRIADMMATMRVSSSIGLVKVEVRVPEWDGYTIRGDAWLEIIFTKGGTLFREIPEVDIHGCASTPRIVVIFDGNESYKVEADDWCKTYFQYICFTKYGFVKIPEDVYDNPSPKYFWQFPEGGRYVFVRLGSHPDLTHEFYVRVVGVAPCAGSG